MAVNSNDDFSRDDFFDSVYMDFSSHSLLTREIAAYQSALRVDDSEMTRFLKSSISLRRHAAASSAFPFNPALITLAELGLELSNSPPGSPNALLGAIAIRKHACRSPVINFDYERSDKLETRFKMRLFLRAIELAGTTEGASLTGMRREAVVSTKTAYINELVQLDEIGTEEMLHLTDDVLKIAPDYLFAFFYRANNARRMLAKEKKGVTVELVLDLYWQAVLAAARLSGVEDCVSIPGKLDSSWKYATSPSSGLPVAMRQFQLASGLKNGVLSTSMDSLLDNLAGSPLDHLLD